MGKIWLLSGFCNWNKICVIHVITEAILSFCKGPLRRAVHVYSTCGHESLL